MITVLGYEKTKNGDAYNVHVSFESSKASLVGIQVATIYVKEDSFESQFGDISKDDLPKQYALNVGFKEITFKEPRSSEWRPYLTF